MSSSLAEVAGEHSKPAQKSIRLAKKLRASDMGSPGGRRQDEGSHSSATLPGHTTNPEPLKGSGSA